MIRQFKDSDMDNVLDIWLEASIAAHDFVDPAFWEAQIDDMRTTYLPASETWVYEDDEGVKGFLSLHGDILAALFVRPAHQGRGIGRNLMQKAKELRGRLQLSVYKANAPSVAFYEKSGFRRVSERLDDHTGHPELVMRFGA